MSFFYFCLSEKRGICYTKKNKPTKRLGEAMSGENIEATAHRKKRVQWIKKCIIWTKRFLTILPTVLCIVLFVRMREADRSLAELTDKMEMLAAETAVQKDMLQELLESMRTTGQGSQMESEASLEVTGYELTVPEMIQKPDEAETVGDSGSDEIETVGYPELDETEIIGDSEPAVTAAHKVYLTFDDGPSTNTEKILDILDSYDVKATFFVVGKESDTAKEALMQIVERGHTLGMHSYSHKYSEIYSSEEAFAEDFVKLRSYLEEVTGVTSDIYRFPGGSSNSVSKLDMHMLIDFLDEENVRFYDWNVSSGDASKTQLSVEQLVKNATKGIGQRSVSVILMHDAVDKATTVEALPIIIEKILAMEDTVILPITEDTAPVQHIQRDNND